MTSQEQRSKSFHHFFETPLVLAIISAGFIACNGDRTGPDTDPLTRTITTAFSVDLTSFVSVTQVVITVEGPDFEGTLAFNLDVDSGRASGVIELPVGSDRLITVRAFNADGIETHRGIITVEVREGTNPSISVTLLPLTGGQPIEIQFGTIEISLSATADTLLVGDTLRLTATVTITAGDTLDVVVVWATLNPGVATVDPAGLVTAAGAGETGIVATFGGVARSTDLLVGTQFLQIVEDSSVGALLYAIEATLAASEGIAVEYWADSASRLRVESPSGTAHRVLMPRLLANTTYRFSVTTPGFLPATGTFTTDSLPTDLQEVSLVSTGQSTSPLIMLELRVPTFQGFVAVDSKGRVVWYHRTAGASWGWTRRANGNFVFLDTGDVLNEVTPAGDIVATLGNLPDGQVIHHDVVATPQNTLYFLTRTAQDVSGTSWVGEVLWEWYPETGAVTQRWNAFDFLSPATDVGARSNPGDWLHANSLHIGPSGNILISSPFLNQIFAITPDFTALAWRLGGPNATIVPDSGATFVFEHSAAELSQGRVLMFDNRRDETTGGVYSRALELSLDFVNGTATTEWSFRAPNDNYSAIISSARRMGNGNTMVAFGASSGLRGSVGPIEVYEVTNSGEVVWNLVVSGPNHMYRATPFERIAGEVEVP